MSRTTLPDSFYSRDGVKRPKSPFDDPDFGKKPKAELARDAKHNVPTRNWLKKKPVRKAAKLDGSLISMSQQKEGTEIQKDIDELVEAGFSESEASKIVEASKKDCKCGDNCKCGMKNEETQNPDDNEDWDTDRLGEDNRAFFEEFHADHGHLPEAEQLELMEAFSKTLNEETFVDRMAAQMGTLLKQSQTSPLTATNVSEAAYKAGDHVIVQSGIHHGKRGIVESTEDTTLSLKSVTDKFGARSMNIEVAVSDIRK